MANPTSWVSTGYAFTGTTAAYKSAVNNVGNAEAVATVDPLTAVGDYFEWRPSAVDWQYGSLVGVAALGSTFIYRINTNNASWIVQEAGGDMASGTWTKYTDVMRIELTATKVLYKVNGVTKYTSLITRPAALYAQLDGYTQNAAYASMSILSTLLAPPVSKKHSGVLAML